MMKSSILHERQIDDEEAVFSMRDKLMMKSSILHERQIDDEEQYSPRETN